MGRTLILGTAGHIDHGKTALVRALTGVDTDRLREEKERGITIDLGFAEFMPGEGVQFGVVDVPGHEGFIRNMLAGATGIDVVLLAVAADEGVMPQTREHLDIVRLLGVETMVVALTKCDLVDEEWLELAGEDVRDLLRDTVFEDAPIVHTSAAAGSGLADLRAALIAAAENTQGGAEEDLARLPIDRVFTVHGTGTVVTGTLWSGTLRDGAKVRILPTGVDGRIRGLQVHGTMSDRAAAGQRTAVALTGSSLKREELERGATVVTGSGWVTSSMLTVWLTVLESSSWEIVDGQRVRVHLGTAEVMARVRLLSGGDLSAGAAGWAQLRLETPLVARGRDPFVIRSYSPVTTIGGGVVVEPDPPKRRRLEGLSGQRLEALRTGSAVDAVRAALELRGWRGADPDALQVLTGLPPHRVDEALAELSAEGSRIWGTSALAASTVEEGTTLLLDGVDRFHASDPLRPGLPLERLRQILPGADPRAVDGLVGTLVEDGLLEIVEGMARRAGFRPSLSDAQVRVRDQLLSTFRAAGLAPPTVDELPGSLRQDSDLWPILKLLESSAELVALVDDLFVDAKALDEAARAVRASLGGREGLGPSDFRDVLPVTRKHLIPLLAYFDRTGVTLRGPHGRDVLED